MEPNGGLDIRRHVITTSTVATGHRHASSSFLIGQRDRSAIIFKLRHNLERLIQGADRTIIKISDLILGVRITQRKHRIFMYHLLKLFREVAPHLRVGESGSANSGCAASSSCNSFIILSNSKSDIVGAEST